MNRSEEAEKKLALPQAALKAAWAFRQGSTSMIRLYPGALDMIEALQEAGVVVALLSNAQACYTRPELEMTGLANVLDDVIISSEEKIRKSSSVPVSFQPPHYQACPRLVHAGSRPRVRNRKKRAHGGQR